MTQIAELVDAPETQALAKIERGDGAMMLATLSDADFDKRLAQMVKGRERIEKIMRAAMKEGTDYGKVPGTTKATLLKPGAETLAKMCGVVPSFEHVVVYGNGEDQPVINVRTICHVHIGSKAGEIVGDGIGSANSHEKKYRYRAAQRACPSCGCEGTILRSKFPDRQTGDKGWYCNEKRGGCGAQFKSDDPGIVEQQGGQVDNPDPFDVENTLLKMAAKRAFIDAILRFTATSGLFTQDVEDIGKHAIDAHEQTPAQAAPAPAQATRPATAGARVGSQNGTRAAAAGQGSGGVAAATGATAGAQVDKINAAQVRAFWAWIGTQQVGLEAVARRIKDTYGVAGSEELTNAQLDDLKVWVRAQAVDAAEPGSDG